MDIMVLDKNFEMFYLIDAYRSMIWTERYNKAGDFELYTEVSGETLKYVTKDCYLSIKDSDRIMIVDTIDIISDRDIGNHIKITGKSLEYILNRRIVWGLQELKTDLQTAIKNLLDWSIISPKNTDRKISNFIFQTVTDSRITGIKIDKQYTGENIYTAVTELCEEYDIGFKVLLNNSNQFVFSLYAGVDRSYDNTANPYVAFSPKFENLVESNYYDSNADFKNITLVAGEDKDKNRKYRSYPESAKAEKGLARRELFTDARDIQSEYKDDDGKEHKLTEAQYNTKLDERGKLKLSECTAKTAFEGEVEPYYSFVFKKDYYLGDIVQIENEYGFGGTARITEVVTSHNESGYSVYPTFEMIEEAS